MSMAGPTVDETVSSNLVDTSNYFFTPAAASDKSNVNGPSLCPFSCIESPDIDNALIDIPYLEKHYSATSSKELTDARLEDSTGTLSSSSSWGSSPPPQPPPAALKYCMNCKAVETPFWRRAADGNYYCNACGLYMRAHNRMRPIELQKSRNGKLTRPRAEVCKNCNTMETPLWRKISTGETVCNACGLYYKLHGIHRSIQQSGRSVDLGGAGGRTRPRNIMPKSNIGSLGDNWHLYIPRINNVTPTATQQKTNVAITRNPYLSAAALLPHHHHHHLYYSHSSHSVPIHCQRNFIDPRLTSISTSTNQQGGFMEERLHDSMRWFSNTCLGSDQAK